MSAAKQCLSVAILILCYAAVYLNSVLAEPLTCNHVLYLLNQTPRLLFISSPELYLAVCRVYLRVATIQEWHLLMSIAAREPISRETVD